MCVYSMVMDHYHDKWKPWAPTTQPTTVPKDYSVPAPDWKSEIEEFKRLLEKAREYDKKHNQPDCGLEEKKKRIKELLEKLGQEVSTLEL